MTAKDVSEHVKKAVLALPPGSAQTAASCLVEPAEVLFQNDCPGQHEPLIKLWLVFDDNRDASNSMLIVFDDAEKRFGHAVKEGPRMSFIGFFDSFAAAFDAL